MVTTAGNPVSPPAATLSAGSVVFVDTNVFVYAATPTAPWHADAAATLTRFRVTGVVVWTSRQVLREYLATMTRPQPWLAQPVPLADAVANVRSTEASVRIAEDGHAATAELLALLGAVPCGGKQIHDANVIATMRAHGIPALLTHNTADFARFAVYITIIPLVPPVPPALPSPPVP